MWFLSAANHFLSEASYKTPLGHSMGYTSLEGRKEFVKLFSICYFHYCHRRKDHQKVSAIFSNAICAKSVSVIIFCLFYKVS